jgi:predicted nucleic acid-binding Zn ribbon protein
MPLRTYRCPKCGHTQDWIEGLDQTDWDNVPWCRKGCTEKHISGEAPVMMEPAKQIEKNTFKLKGSRWAKDGYK